MLQSPITSGIHLINYQHDKNWTTKFRDEDFQAAWKTVLVLQHQNWSHFLAFAMQGVQFDFTLPDKLQMGSSKSLPSLYMLHFPTSDTAANTVSSDRQTLHSAQQWYQHRGSTDAYTYAENTLWKKIIWTHSKGEMSFSGHSLCFNFQVLPILLLLHSEKVPQQTLPPAKLTSTSEHTFWTNTETEPVPVDLSSLTMKDFLGGKNF